MIHTPGPWQVHYSPDGKATEFLPPTGSELMEAVCIVPHDDITDEGLREITGNMALIKNLPGMIQALETIKDTTDVESDPDGALLSIQQTADHILGQIQKDMEDQA